jgi:hypothetical protein
MSIRQPRIVGEGIAIRQYGLAFPIQILQQQRQVIREQRIRGEPGTVHFFGCRMLAAQMQQPAQIDSCLHVVCIRGKALEIGRLSRLCICVLEPQGTLEMSLGGTAGCLRRPFT